MLIGVPLAVMVVGALIFVLGIDLAKEVSWQANPLRFSPSKAMFLTLRTPYCRPFGTREKRSTAS